MDTHHKPVEIDQHNLENARRFWSGFTNMSKYGIIAVIALLLAMWFFLL